MLLAHKIELRPTLEQAEFAVLHATSTKVFAANQKLRQNLTKLKHKQRSLSRKVRGSHRYVKAKQAVAKLHYRIANQRLATCHEVSITSPKTSS